MKNNKNNNIELTQLNKGVRTSLKRALKDEYKYLKIGYDYYYKENKVTIIPIEIGNAFYATVQNQGSNYTVTIDRMSKKHHVSYLSKYYRELHTDNLDDLGRLFKDYMDTIVL